LRRVCVSDVVGSTVGFGRRPSIEQAASATSSQYAGGGANNNVYIQPQVRSYAVMLSTTLL